MANELPKLDRSYAIRKGQMLAKRQSIRLSEGAAVAFGDALRRPAQPNKRLADALEKPRKFSWIEVSTAKSPS